jgi:hypothetical protein
LRSWQFLSWSRNFPHFEENAGSLLYSIQPSAYSYPQPNMSTVQYSTVQYSTVCTLSHSFFKTVAKHWWIQVDWKHWFNLFFPKYRKRVCSRTQWPDLSPLPTFPWHITYFLSQEVIFLKYLRILRLLTHRKIGSQTPCNRTLQNRHWLMLIKISLEQTSIRPKNWEKSLAVSVQKVNIPKFSKLESTKLFKSEFCGSWVVAC